MGKQFKTFANVSRQVTGNDSGLENASINKHTGIDTPGEVKPLLHLPMRSSVQATPRPNTQHSQPGVREIIPTQAPAQAHPGIEDYPTRRVNALVAPPSAPFAGRPSAPSAPGMMTTPWPGKMPGQFEGAQVFAEQKVPPGKKAEEQKQRVQAWQQQKKRQRQRKSRTLLTTVLSCCLGLLALSGGGFWLYQAHTSAPANAPAAVPTQTKYTIVSGAPSSTATASTTATARGTASTGSGAIGLNMNSLLKPVPAPWQTDGQLIVVSISAQKLTAYDHGKPAMTILVTTGMPALYTPQATYHIIGRVANSMFYSPWPASSPYYYAPIHVNYGLQLTSSGIYLHDATWRSVFGPGTNVPHKDPVYGEESGSHGCVELPLQAMSWLYNWALNGIAVAVIS